MRRNARLNQHEDNPAASFHNIIFNDSAPNEDFLQMDVLSSNLPATNNKNTYRFENTMEVKVEMGDTLQAIALRFHCSAADIRRLNKIDKDNEIHARNVVKIPVTVHNILLDNLPIVHKSGNNSPKTDQKSGGSRDSNSGLSSIIRNPLEDAEAMLSEKLMVASVNSSGLEQPSTSKAGLSKENRQNNLALHSKRKSNAVHKNFDKEIPTSYDDDTSAPLITDILDDSTSVPQLHRIRGPSFRTIDWSGSDCDMSWICLFVVILALCFVIPLLYVFYIAEHSHHNTTGTIASSKHWPFKMMWLKKLIN